MRVYGDWLPRQVVGRFTALCAVVRMLYLALVVGLLSVLRGPRWDVTFCDGVSAMVPVLRFFNLPVRPTMMMAAAAADASRVPYGSRRKNAAAELARRMLSSVCCASSQVLFYCHYPDKLLCTERRSLLKRLYRAPLDWLEEATTGTRGRKGGREGGTPPSNKQSNSQAALQ